MKSNVILIGMPGSGKSACGVLAAKALCMRFLDADIALQEKEGMSLQQIVDQRGTDGFKAAESACLSALKCDNTMIATGGSAVYYDGAMRALKANGIAVYLRIGMEEMIARISDYSSRGILLPGGETLEEMYSEREPLYRKYADFLIDNNGKTIEEAVGEICLLARSRGIGR